MTVKALNDNTIIGVLGLGYVGLPLAHAFAAHFKTVGFDIDNKRVEEINNGIANSLALSAEELKANTNIEYTTEAERLKGCDIYIVTAPTPVDAQNQPDLEPVLQATRQIAQYLSAGDTVIFESTVYPGATEEECVPILESVSGLQFNKEFFVGYSPERINPGDNNHSLTQIVKVTSGSSPESAQMIDDLYQKIITAGTHSASSIRVAEAAKVIENTQRDLNIALVNELAVLFDKLEIDTNDVLAAAGSKWNFLPFSPGLVGGHCIGVDPYYLTYKAQQVGHNPDVILAGRRINDSMGSYVAERVVRLMLSKQIHILGSKILIMGYAFKENCPDTRNTRVEDIASTLLAYHAEVQIYDPWVDSSDSEHLISEPENESYDAVIVAVAHQQFIDSGIDYVKSMSKKNSVIFDVKHIFDSSQVDGSL
ncbi:MAG: nucleotide sugar dehydrogenase [Pseudomonadales bacterium]|nr:nucleotide sugar dehydrogenase [Pseudomonadales bacterium]